MNLEQIYRVKSIIQEIHEDKVKRITHKLNRNLLIGLNISAWKQFDRINKVHLKRQ